MYVLRLAWRYAVSRKINAVAFLALGLVMTIQIVVMAVLEGQYEDMKDRVRNMGEQVSIRFGLAAPTEKSFEAVADALAKLQGVKGATPVVRSYGLLEHRGYVYPVLFTGIDLSREVRFSQLPDHLLDKKLDLQQPTWAPPGAEADEPAVFLGEWVANNLAIRAGETVRLVFQKPGTDTFDSMTLPVGSVFRSGSPMEDQHGVLLPIELAQEMVYGRLDPRDRERVTLISVWLDDVEAADALAEPIAQTVEQVLGEMPAMEVTTWKERWHNLAEGMAHENRLQELILGLVELSSGFCIFAILATLVARRARDLGLLRCIGASRRAVVSVFLLVGLFFGMVGSALGVAGGYFLTSQTTARSADGTVRTAPRIDAYYEKLTGTPLYPPRMFGVQGAQGLPVVVRHDKVLTYVLGGLLISLLAAAYPAIWAGLREPVEALRDE